MTPIFLSLSWSFCSGGRYSVICSASPAASRYSASTPALLKWLDKWNEGKPYRDQVRPFGFLLSYTARTGVFAPCGEGTVVVEVKAGRPRKTHEPKPIAPYDTDPVSADDGRKGH